MVYSSSLVSAAGDGGASGEAELYVPDVGGDQEDDARLQDVGDDREDSNDENLPSVGLGVTQYDVDFGSDIPIRSINFAPERAITIVDYILTSDARVDVEMSELLDD